jgi:dUTP pyrophosphatase
MSSSLPVTTAACPGAAVPAPNGPASERDAAASVPVDVLLQRLDDGLPLPDYAHEGDAGADLRTAVDVTLRPGERATVPTGVAVALPPGYAGFVHPRSGLAARHGVTVVNAPGTVDAGYRGEIQVTLLNTDAREPVTLRRGDRVAQLVVQRVERAAFVVVEELPASGRGSGGHGSTGGFADAVTDRTMQGGAPVPEGGTR